jgi:hypothetical protein
VSILFSLHIIGGTLAVFKRRPDYEQQNKQTNNNNIAFAAGMRRSGTGKDKTGGAARASGNGYPAG